MPVKRTCLLLAAQLSLFFNVFAQDSLSHQSVADTTHPAGMLPADSTVSISNFSLTAAPQKQRAAITPKPISLRSVVVPVAMIGYGALTLSSEELKEFNQSVRDEVARKNGTSSVHFEDYTKYLPAIAVYGLNLAGVKGKHDFVDRTMLYGMSNLIGSGIVASTKRLTNVLRPDSSNRLSFPSGHTAGAFIAAEFLRQEYKDVSPWYGVAGYVVAAGTGYLRMYNNKHWLNDVVAGAGIGILSTRISYWLYPKLKNAVFKNKNTSTLVAPIYQNGALGLGLVHRF